MAGSKLVIVTRQGLLARSGAEWAWTVCSADQRGWSGTAPHWVTTQMLRRRQPLTAELRKRNARARLQKAGIPRDLMAAYIRSPTTLRTHTIGAEEKTAVPRSRQIKHPLPLFCVHRFTHRPSPFPKNGESGRQFLVETSEQAINIPTPRARIRHNDRAGAIA